jgi:hypothetical protein
MEYDFDFSIMLRPNSENYIFFTKDDIYVQSDSSTYSMNLIIKHLHNVMQLSLLNL